MNFVEFALNPVDDIEPWEREGSRSLSWFGFSCGRYRLKFGGDYLLQYSEEAVMRMTAQCPDAYPGPWVDYYVVRLWEDLIRLVPYILPPVPEALWPLVRIDDLQWCSWIADAIDATDDGAVSERDVELLRQWRSDLCLHSTYLSPSARIWFANLGGHVEVRWDNREKLFEGVCAWSAVRGVYSMPVRDFIEGVKAFDHAFVSAMGARVEFLLERGYRPEVRVDMAQLAAAQRDRSGWFAKELMTKVEDQSDATIAAVRAVMSAIPLPQ
jgi:hypothetical protein